MKKYLVTGGAGFIGSHVTGALLEQGVHVRILDNFSTGKRENLAELIQFNVCTGVETRLLDLLEALYQLFPNVPKPEFAAPRAGNIYRSVGSLQKAADLMDYRAQVSLAEGLKETVDWMSTNHSLVSNL